MTVLQIAFALETAGISEKDALGLAREAIEKPVQLEFTPRRSLLYRAEELANKAKALRFEASDAERLAIIIADVANAIGAA